MKLQRKDNQMNPGRNQEFSKCAPITPTAASPENLLEVQIRHPLPTPIEAETPELGPRNLSLNKVLMHTKV